MISIASGTVGAFTMTGWKRRSSAPSFSMYVRYASSVFFFSSRRRHTRSKRDWSSDVCSSDLLERKKQRRLVRWHPEANEVRAPAVRGVVRGVLVQDQDRAIEDPREARVVTRQIGRASCRERVESAGGGGGFEKKSNGVGGGLV